MVGSKDEEDNMINEQQRKVARKLEKDSIRLQDRIMHLEEDNASLQRKNDSLEQRCEELMRENGNLVRLLEETKRKAYRSGLQEHAEQEAVKEEAEREARIRDQSLIKSPLMNHIKQVMGTSDEQMAWQLSTKAPYALHVPQQKEWTCTDLYSHQKDNVITEMGVALASKVDPSAKKQKSEEDNEEAMDIF
jgi:predicted RNase H-like nuclease (RuvC/YqgF family)